jgi:hypothetical protein
MPTLAQYEAATLRLLNDTNPPTLYSQSQIDANINNGRVQIAGDAECIRRLPSLNTVATQRAYNWSGVSFAAGTGVGGILNVRDIGRQIPVIGGFVKLFGRSWEWLNTFYIQKPVPNVGIPTRWATFQPGDSGVFYVDPIPDGVYTLQLDTVCFPIPLTGAGGEVDAVLFPWSDAVPYYAAYLSFLDQMRTADADSMFTRYRLFALRGTQLTTPTQLPDNFPGGSGAQQAMGRSLVGGPAEQRR